MFPDIDGQFTYVQADSPEEMAHISCSTLKQFKSLWIFSRNLTSSDLYLWRVQLDFATCIATYNLLNEDSGGGGDHLEFPTVPFFMSNFYLSVVLCCKTGCLTQTNVPVRLLGTRFLLRTRLGPQ
jgi:hypothetical protein